MKPRNLPLSLITSVYNSSDSHSTVYYRTLVVGVWVPSGPLMIPAIAAGDNVDSLIYEAECPLYYMYEATLVHHTASRAHQRHWLHKIETTASTTFCSVRALTGQSKPKHISASTRTVGHKPQLPSRLCSFSNSVVAPPISLSTRWRVKTISSRRLLDFTEVASFPEIHQTWIHHYCRPSIFSRN